MIRISRLLAAFALAVSAAACTDLFSADTWQQYEVLGSRTVCWDWISQVPCYRVVDVANNDTTAFYMTQVEGFSFEEGIRQRIIVSVEMIDEPLQDGPDRVLRLVRVVSRTPVSVTH